MNINGVDYEVVPARVVRHRMERDSDGQLRFTLLAATESGSQTYVSPNLVRPNHAQQLRPWTSEQKVMATGVLSEYVLAVCEVFRGAPSSGVAFFLLLREGEWVGMLSSDEQRYFLPEILARYVQDREQEARANEP